VKTMFMSKLKAVVGVVLMLGLIVTGATVLSSRTATARGGQPPAAEEPVATTQKQEKEKEKEAFIAWGKEVGGLQAGLGFHPGQKRAYSHGETVKIVLRVRNVGKEAVEFKHIGAFFVENPPTITDADGKMIQLPRCFAEGKQMPHSTNVAPGKEVELYEWKFDLRPEGESSKNLLTIHGTGKFSLQCERIVGPTSFNPQDPNPTLSKLATGKLELEIKADAPPDNEKKAPTKPEPEKDKEAFTAWGKEVGGLQAGLGFKVGEHRAYRLGETATLVVRVRNVGKEEVRFQYLRQFFIENPPTVTDGTGNVNQLGKVSAFGQHFPVEVKLAAGKEIELYEWTPYLGTGTEEGIPNYPYIIGTGKFQVQYEKVLGNSSSGTIKIDPALDKLATGKLEIEVKEPEKMSPEKEAFTAWGKEVGGLQAGLGYRPGEKRIYTHGETVNLVVRVRNVSKEEVKFQYLKEFFNETPPTVTNGKGTPVIIPGYLDTAILHTPVNVSLAPGKEIELYPDGFRHELKLELRPASESGNRSASTLYGTGKIQIQYERVFGNSFVRTIELDPILSKLATGKLELEVKADAPPENDKKAPPKQEPGQEKEAFTAWGKEVAGLQAGLGYQPGQKRAYSPGETVKLVVRVRNVGKEAVKFQYLKEFFIETPPTVTGGDGKAVPLGRRDAGGLVHVPAEVNLAPGKEIELAELKLDPRSGAQSAHPGQWNLWEIGKFSVQYERLVHPDIDKTLGTLATGKLELVIKTTEELEKPPQK
jgi:hypothetical protein